MNNPLILLLIGWFLGLVSSLVGFFIQYYFERKKNIFQLKNNPTVFLYNKQSEFYEKLIMIIIKLKDYVNTVSQFSTNSDIKTNNSDQNIVTDSCVKDLYNLLCQYSYFLPTALWIEVDEVLWNCASLATKQNKENITKCYTSFYDLENVVRKYIGVDQLSKELLKSFYQGKINNNKK